MSQQKSNRLYTFIGVEWHILAESISSSTEQVQMLTSAFESARKHCDSKAEPAIPLYELIAVDVAKHAATMFLDQRGIADVRVVTQWRQDGTDSGACLASNALQDNMHVDDNEAMQITEGYLHTCCSLKRLH